MTYDIRIDTVTAAGEKLGMVFLRHAPESADKIMRIRENMLRDGWTGRPVILLDSGEYHIALSGSHRLAAAMGIDGVIEAVMLPELSGDEWDVIDAANDDDDLLAALIEVSEGRDDMMVVVEAMRAEVEANKGA